MFARPSPAELRQKADDRKAANMAALMVPSRARGTMAGGLRAAVPKTTPRRSEAYRRLVAALPCALCFVHGHSQAAHADESKGMGIKSDDRTCYPACAPHDGRPGCHWLIGTSGKIPRDERRALEQRFAQETRAKIINRGQWPAGLPAWRTP